MAALDVDRIYPPFFVTEIGRVFYNETSYFTCDINDADGNNEDNSLIGPMNSLEVWFRVDPLDKRPDGYISTLFTMVDAANNYLYGLRMSNTFLRVHMQDVIHDVNYNFTDSDMLWHYAAVSITRVHQHQMKIKLFIDGAFAFEETYLDILSWNTFLAYTNGDLSLEIGRDFPGVIRKVKLNAQSYCEDETSLWIETTAANCN